MKHCSAMRQDYTTRTWWNLLIRDFFIIDISEWCPCNRMMEELIDGQFAKCINNGDRFNKLPSSHVKCVYQKTHLLVHYSHWLILTPTQKLLLLSFLMKKLKFIFVTYMTYLMKHFFDDICESWRLSHFKCQFDCVSLAIRKSWYTHYDQHSNINIAFFPNIDRLYS